ncbi:MAG TPA: hypothetical protein VFN74_02905 [Chloroflexota bacterium]|nr:hypothetical protein [Chloroflexota bacterium]
MTRTTRSSSFPVAAARPVRWTMLALILIAVLLLVVRSASAQTPVDPPYLPAPNAPTGDLALDRIYYGAVPAGGESAPVLVFVPGLGGVAADWWGPTFVVEEGDNDMYALAYRSGYRTAFVTLTERGEPGNDKWENGKRLATQINAIATHYGVDRVNLVGHSKGGIDSHAAIVGRAGEFAGAVARVRNLITLSTPHQGSAMADFAMTERGQSLLNQVGLPFKVDGALAGITTEAMAAFRAEVDAQTEINRQVRFFTAGGTSWGPQNGVLRISGSFLGSSEGASDGLVTVASTVLPSVPCSRVLFVQPYTHFDVHLGRNAIRWIHAVMQRYGTGIGCTQPAPSPAISSIPLLGGISIP